MNKEQEDRAVDAYRQMARDIEEEQGTPEQRRQARNERYQKHQEAQERPGSSTPTTDETTGLKRGYGDLNGLIFPDTLRISTRRTPGLTVGEHIVLEDISDNKDYDAVVLHVHERGAIVRFDWSTVRNVGS